MAGLGLASGIRAYQQGVEWKQRQEDDAVARSVRDEQIARQREMRAKLEEANKEFGRVIDESKAQWGLNGAQGQYTPNEETMFRAAEARGAALARHGMWDEFMANEAKVAPMRQQARMKAVQRFEVDGDAESLARAIYPTLFDGKRLKSVTRDDGNGTGPAALMMEMDDGSKHAMPVDKLYQAAKMAADPEALKREAMLNYQRALSGFHTEGRLKEIEAQGNNQRAVANIQADARVDAAEVRGKYANETARIRAAAQEASAKIRGPSGGKGGSLSSADVARFRALEVASRSHMESIRKEIATLENAQKEARPADRTRYAAKLEALNDTLQEARNAHNELVGAFSRGGGGDDPPAAPTGGLSIKADASPATATPTTEQAMGLAAADARDQGATVQFDLGGQRGTVSPSGVVAQGGGLGSVAPAKPTKPTSKPDKPAAEPKPGKGPDMAAAERIKADFKAGKLTRDQAAKKLRELGFK